MSIEKFGESQKSEIREPQSRGEREKERAKEKSKEIRKMLERAITESLETAGLEKVGYSTWLRKIRNKFQLVYLQRSLYSNSYYIEAGICDAKDIPENEKPNVIHCNFRDRIESIVNEKNGKGRPEKEQLKKQNEVNDLLNFEKESKKYPAPIIDLDEAQKKIEALKNLVQEYIPWWFDKNTFPKIEKK